MLTIHSLENSFLFNETGLGYGDINYFSDMTWHG
jgi:hypothetical protein